MSKAYRDSFYSKGFRLPILYNITMCVSECTYSQYYTQYIHEPTFYFIYPMTSSVTSYSLINDYLYNKCVV